MGFKLLSLEARCQPLGIRHQFRWPMLVAMSQPLLVLGARVVDGDPGPMLATRLDKAIELASHLPEPIIVSGKGEAEAMQRYLVDHGIDPRRIVVEPDATSTNENLERAVRLSPDAELFHVITSDFHIVRTRLWAWHLGIPVRMHSARTPWSLKASNYLREVVATPHSALRVLWRKWRV